MSVAEKTTYFLEMLTPGDLKASVEPDELTINEVEIKQYRFNRFLYQLVGEQWQWTFKLGFSIQQWKDYAESPQLRTFVAYHRGSIAGYYEIQQQAQGNVEICNFGLAPEFIGKGFGGYLLSHAIQSAWSWPDTMRVWVSTCSLDHPSALPNYLARGFSLYQTETSPDH